MRCRQPMRSFQSGWLWKWPLLGIMALLGGLGLALLPAAVKAQVDTELAPGDGVTATVAGQVTVSITVTTADGETLSFPLVLDVSTLYDLEANTPLTLTASVQESGDRDTALDRATVDAVIAGIALVDRGLDEPGVTTAIVTLPEVTPTPTATVRGPSIRVPGTVATPQTGRPSVRGPSVTPEPTASPEQAAVTITGTVVRRVMLREGPGTEFPARGAIPAGTVIEITGQNEEGSWYRLVDSRWAPAALVANLSGEPPVVDAAGAAAGVAGPTPTPIVEDEPAAVVLSPEMEAYGGELTPYMEEFAEIFTNFFTLLGEMRMADAGWLLGLQEQALGLRAVADGLAAIQPPAEAVTMHDDIVDAVDECTVAVEVILEGLENSNFSVLQEGIVLAEACAITFTELEERYPDFGQAQ
jgi:hypothetical protein